MASDHPAPTIDLNADVGEGLGAWTLGDDSALLDVVTSANVACGFHAGDPTIMRNVCERAAERSVRIGAHVGYRDLFGFGRRRIDVPADVLADDVLYQVAALDGFAHAAGSSVGYVKPHGALNHATVDDAVQAAAVLTAITAYHRPLAVLVQPGSELERLAHERGLPTYREAFPDRGYGPDGRLVPRGEPGAMVHDPDEVAGRALDLAGEGRVRTANGGQVELSTRSLCVHGDTPGAVEMSRRVRAALEGAGFELAPFC